MIRHVIFDLDGTLLYTLDSILYPLNATLASEGLKEITIDQCRDFIGDGARLLVRRAVGESGDVDNETIERVLREYNAAYNSDPLPYTYPYDGITSLVDGLVDAGITVGVVTNKPEPTAIQLVRHFFGDKVAFVRGGRSGAVLKPDPTDTLDALTSHGGVPSECAFVGDTAVDVRTARNMRAALCIGVLWGFRTREELERESPDIFVEEAHEILGAILGYEEN